MGFFICSVLLPFCFLFSLDPQIDPHIYKNKYGYYYVPKDHNRPATKMIKSGKVYELKTLEYIQSIYEPGTSIVHAGTYFGDMLSFYSNLVGPNKVWAFEPVKLNYKCAEINIELNNLNNINLFNVALSDQKGFVSMQTKSNGRCLGGASRIKIKDEKVNSEYEYVQTLCLDEVLKNNEDRISVIQLDVEEHEIQVLIGAKDTIQKHKPTIIVELLAHKKNEIDNYLTSLDYVKVFHVNGNGCYVPILN